jgi:hypothetical protein
MKEDVAELILNIKLLSAKLYTEQPKIVTIDAVGPCEVTAADIKADDEVEIVNPELHLATLSEGGHLQMQITLEKGRGYVSAERNKQLAVERNKVAGMPIGVIPVDSIFTPIRKVSYSVEDTRVGQVTDYDKLTIEVWTNGSILPKEQDQYKAMKVVREMYARGYEFMKIDLARCRATKMCIIDGKIMPCLNKIDGLGDSVAANIVGTARKNENSAAFLRVSFCAIPPTMVAIERETPGIIEMHWNIPIQNARFSVSAVFSSPLLNILSQNSMNMPPSMSVTATTVTLSSMASIMSLNSSPSTAAGMNATNSFQ